MTTHVVVMGVSGCGKSSIAQLISDRLGWPVTEGDDLHPEANIAKMSAGTPLTDEDRWPWLRSIVAANAEAGQDTIVTCSALKRAYRGVLREAPGRTTFVHLAGDQDLIAARMSARKGHFMPPTLLPSQFATLEPLGDDEDGIVLDLRKTPDQLADEAVAFLRATGAAPQKDPA